MQSPQADPMQASILLDSRPKISDLTSIDGQFKSAAVTLTLLVWTISLAERMLSYVIEQGIFGYDLYYLLLVRTLITVVGIFFSFVMHVFVSSIRATRFSTRAIISSVIAILFGYVFAQITYYVMNTMAPQFVADSPSYSNWLDIWRAAYWRWFFLAWTAFYLALLYSFEIKASERRARMIESLAHAAQLRALHNQISPHFMFNTLNSISALMLDRQPDHAEAMLRQLSDFLRATLALDPLSDISLTEELRVQAIYLAIHQFRFPDMQVTIDCPAEVTDALVPALLMQPLVENAVKYGVAQSPLPTTIRIVARRDAEQLILTVSDDARASGAKQAGLGVGLRNVRERLQGRFGPDHDFEAGPTDGGGFRVTLALPFTVKAQ